MAKAPKIKADKIIKDNLCVTIEIKKPSKCFSIRNSLSLFILRLHSIVSPLETTVKVVRRK